MITLASDLSIASVNELKQLLADALREGGDVSLDGEAVERVDTSAIQLLLAFKRELDTAHASLQWQSPSPQLLSGARLLGVDALLGIV